MFCPKCGKENAPGTQFCQSCGEKLTEVNQSSNGTPVQEPIPSSEIGKKSKKAKGAIIAAVIVLIIAVAGIITALFFPKIEAAVLGESSYYLLKESKNITSILTEDSLDVLRHPGSYSASSVAKIEIDEESSDEADKEFFDSIQVKANVNYEQSSATVNSDLSIDMSDEQVVKLTGDYIDSKIIVGTDFSDAKLAFDNPFLDVNSFVKQLSGGDGSESSDGEIIDNETEKIIECLSEVDTKELVVVVSDVLKENLDAKAEKTSEEINGVNATVVTFELSGSDIDDLLLSLCKAAENNDKLKPTMDKLNELASEEGDVGTLSEYVEEYSSFDEMIDKLTLKYATDFRGNIIYRGYVLDFSFDYQSTGDINTTFEDGEVATIEAEFSPDTDSDYKADFKLEKTTEGKSSNITAEFGDESDRVNIDLTDLRVEKCGGVPTLLGNLSFEYKYSDIENYIFTAEATKNDDVYDISLDFKNLFKADISTTLSNKCKITENKVPDNCETNIIDYLEETFTEIGNKFSERLDAYYDAYYDDYDYGYYDDSYYDDSYYDYGYYDDSYYDDSYYDDSYYDDSYYDDMYYDDFGYYQ